MNTKGRYGLGQSGMVSFMVTLIMMTVITLIVVGFSQVTRRNERETLDRQLSAQAFYAAESGVNVTKATLTKYLGTSAATMSSKTTCANDYPNPGQSSTPIVDISPTTNVRYTCVLVDPNPSTLVYDKLSQGSSVVVPINASAPLKTLTFSWTTQSGLSGSCSTPQSRSYLPAASSWNCPFALLRVDLMQVPNPAMSVSDVTTQLAPNTATLFLTPYGDKMGTIYDNAAGTSGSSIGFGGSTTVYYGSASGCTTTANCVVNTQLAAPQSVYYARITPLYHDVGELIISGQTSGGSAATFNGTQAVIDVTGQAQDELRRVQVRVGLTGAANDIPANALASGASICKDFTILPTDNVDASTVCK